MGPFAHPDKENHREFSAPPVPCVCSQELTSSPEPFSRSPPPATPVGASVTCICPTTLAVDRPRQATPFLYRRIPDDDTSCQAAEYVDPLPVAGAQVGGLQAWISSAVLLRLSVSPASFKQSDRSLVENIIRASIPLGTARLSSGGFTEPTLPCPMG